MKIFNFQFRQSGTHLNSPLICGALGTTRPISRPAGKACCPQRAAQTQMRQFLLLLARCARPSSLAGLLLIIFSSAFELKAGTITGMVRAEGKPGTEIDPLGNNKYNSRQFKFAE